MPATRRVTVERNRLRFAAAHMATFGGGCEPLHGHNYDVLIEIEGELTEDSWVWDFGGVKRAARTICERAGPPLPVAAKQQAPRHRRAARCLDGHLRRPKLHLPQGRTCYSLPIENTTAECISEWFAGRLLAALREQGATHLKRFSVGIEEMPGQTGWYTLEM